MCELFGVNSSKKTMVNDMLKELVAHSEVHRNGWGLAVFYENSVSLEKEPVQASKSLYLKERLRHKIEVKNMIAHIRLATIGNVEYENSHPFVKRDNSGRSWTLAHNGTIFDYPELNPYIYEQEGRTDSERILFYLVDQINREQFRLGHPLCPEERFELLDDLVGRMSKGNKLNLLIFDGEYMYVHTNYADSLYYRQEAGCVSFATVPLTKQKWEPVPFTTLCVYRNGEKVYQGTNHGNEYIEDPIQTASLYADYAAL